MILEQEIDRACRRFSSTHSKAVSTQTRVLLRDVLAAIVLDPHPRWQEAGDELEEFLKTTVSSLPQTLADVAETQRVTDEITSFDLIHYMGEQTGLIFRCPLTKL